MSLQLILGSSGAGKSHKLYEEIIKNSFLDDRRNHLVIVPEQFTLQTQRDIVDFHPRKAIMNIDVLSFGRFAFRIFDEIGSKALPILDDTGKNMVLRKVLDDNKEELVLFNRNIKNPGFINELKSILSEFYQYGIKTDNIKEMIKISQNRPLLKAKLKDITKVYEAFSEFIDNKYLTAEEILEVLYNIIDDTKWARNSYIYFDGFTGFTPIQFKIMEKLLQLGNKIHITLTIDDREDLGFTNNKSFYQTNLFGISLVTINKLKEICDKLQVEFKEVIYPSTYNNRVYRFKNSLPLASLEKNIFRYPYEVYEDEQEDIILNEFRDYSSEISFVAAQIKKLIREKSYRYKDIAIITGDIDSYATIVANVFEENNIPYFIDHKREVLSNPFVEILRAILNMVINNFDYESVFRYLRTGLTSLNIDEIDILENYVIAKGIRGYKAYNENFTRTYKSREKLNMEEINNIREKFIEEISLIYNELKEKNTLVKDYVTSLYEHGIRLDIEEKLYNQSEEFLQDGLPIYSKEYRQIYDIVINLYEQMILLLGDEHVDIKEFSHILEAGLTEAKVGVIPPGVDEIVIGDMKRTRLRDIKALFFIGLNDGIVPSINMNGGLLSDLDRQLLLNNDFELSPSIKEEAFIDQFYIYLNMTKPKEKLYLSYYNLNEDGKSIRPSYLVNKILLLFKKLIITKEKEDDIDIVLNNKGIAYLTNILRDYPNTKLTDLWKEIYIYYLQNEDIKRKATNLIKAKFHRNMEHNINKDVATLLYGRELVSSVTRLESYEACSFAHFLNYGLELREREEYTIAMPDIGNIFHNAIDNFSKALDESDYTWHSIPDDVRDEMAEQVVVKSIEDYENSFIKSSKRNEYLIERIKRITIRTLWALCNQIKQGSFIPYAYEKGINYFLDNNDILLKGRIDRLDIYEDENNMFLRIIDYKSGKISFDYEEIYYGLQQQLSIYLKGALDILSKEHPEKNIIPAGIFYYGIDDPIVDKTEDYLNNIYKKLKLDGLVNSDKEVIISMDSKLGNKDGELIPSMKSDIIPVAINKDMTLGKVSKVASKKEIEALLDYVENRLEDGSKEILNGVVKINPYQLKNKKACDYCPFKSVCGFDLRLPEHNYRKLGNVSMEDIKKEIFGLEDGDKNEVD